MMDSSQGSTALSQTAQASKKLPEMLGKYHVLHEVARGNMGIVYTAYDPFADLDVAIKVFFLADQTDKEIELVARKQFYKEARIALALDHPNILRVLDAGEDGGHPYIVMEYVEGGRTLALYSKPPDLLPVTSAAEIIYKIANALDYVHHCGVIHGDIKPANIMLTQTDDVKLGDFGIARQYFEKDPIEHIMVSPRFMSPEQARGDSLTNQTDLYSLGVVMFELLTGRPLFPGQTLADVINDTLHKKPPRLRDLRPDVPEGLEVVLEAALQRDLERRYKLGREMASDLLALFEHIGDPQPLSAEEKFQALRSLQFFNGFSDADIQEISRASRWTTYAPGDRIVAGGEADTSLFVVVSGQVVLVRDGEKCLTIARGHCFGDAVDSAGTKRRNTISAEDSVLLVEFNPVRMAGLSQSCQQRLYEVFLRALFHRLG
jgi:serine/threonine protein kinase